MNSSVENLFTVGSSHSLLTLSWLKINKIFTKMGCLPICKFICFRAVACTMITGVVFAFAFQFVSHRQTNISLIENDTTYFIVTYYLLLRFQVLHFFLSLVILIGR